MKILYLMEYPIDLPGGGQMSTQTLCEGITAYSNRDLSSYRFGQIEDDNKYEAVVACPNLLNRQVSDYPFKIVTYPSDENRELSKISRLKNFFERIGHFKRIIDSEQPDVIHVSMSESLISFGFLRCLGFFSKIPFVYTDRGLCYGYRKHSKICIKATLKHAKYMLTTTAFNKGLWDKEELRCPVKVIHNTISPAFDDFDPEGRIRERAKYGLNADELVIGFAGRISEEKDWMSVPGIVKALKDSGCDFKVALVLSVYEDRDAKMVADIKSGIIDAIGEDRLIYMQDLNQAQISDYYYMVDIFVMTSIFESFGKAAVEAMSRKCAVLSTKVGGLPEVIGKEEDLYDKSDLRSFTERVRQLNSDRELLEAEREYFYKRYKDNFTKESNVLKHIDVYRSCKK